MPTVGNAGFLFDMLRLVGDLKIKGDPTPQIFSLLTNSKIKFHVSSAFTGYHRVPIGIRRVARVVKMRAGSIKQNRNFKKSQELKGRSEKFKNQLRFLYRA
jgi:hypothetical protein